MSGVPAYPGWLAASMVSWSEIIRGESKLMVKRSDVAGLGGGMLKSIVPPEPASWIAWRSEPGPESRVLVTVVALRTVTSAENADVPLLFDCVATTWDGEEPTVTPVTEGITVPEN